MKFSAAALLVLASYTSADSGLRNLKKEKPGKGDKSCEGKKGKKKSYSERNAPLWRDNSERLLLREGVIDSLPSSLCDDVNSDVPKGKNVILVMGWDGKWSVLEPLPRYVTDAYL